MISALGVCNFMGIDGGSIAHWKTFNGKLDVCKKHKKRERETGEKYDRYISFPSRIWCCIYDDTKSMFLNVNNLSSFLLQVFLTVYYLTW